MQKKHIWNRVPATAALFIVGALGLAGVACGVNPASTHDFDEVAETMEMLDIPGLTFTGTCVFNANNGNVVLTLLASNKVIVGRDSGNGNITINGNSTQCQNANYANTKILAVTAPTGSGETLVLDYSNGTFAMSTGTVLTGTQVDLGGDNAAATGDSISIRTTDSNALSQNITVGTNGLYMTALNQNDLLLVGGHNVWSLTLALGAGNDRVNAKGAANLGGAAGSIVVVYGNGGADTLYASGANFNDLYSGGDGNDTIYVPVTLTASNVSRWVLDGGNGIDTVDFSARTAATTIYNSGTFVSGDLAQAENIKITNAEILVGGSGPDFLQGGSPNTNQWLYGGPGNDNFVQGGTGAGDSNDTIYGGPGVDVVNYSARTISVNVTLDGNPNDGSTAEIDNIGVDVENVVTGSGADLVVGNANSNVLDAGSGINTIQGLGGDDSFLQSVSGTDTIACGAGTDTIDYSPRAVTIVAALDGTTPSGTTSEADVLGTDCENLNGAGKANATTQTLTGNTGDNVISGGISTGAVTINCMGGQDIAVGDTGASNAPGAISNCEIVIP